jgi:hypothetical protein
MNGHNGNTPARPGEIRMSPLMYGSLRYIATCHQNGGITAMELLDLDFTMGRMKSSARLRI